MKPVITEPKYPSASSSMPLHELMLRKESRHDLNLQQLSQAIPGKRNDLNLLQFFKHRRYQQVVVSWSSCDEQQESRGKVVLIGRNFVILSNLLQRFWLPFSVIKSAYIPYDLPNLSSSSHQHVVFDHRLRRQLMNDFGKTVSGRYELVSRFYEQSLQGYLKSFEGKWLRVQTSAGSSYYMAAVQNGQLISRGKSGSHTLIPHASITCIHEIPLLAPLSFIARLRLAQR
ncbi:hypothetical protein [Paenibacillus tarimensis]|uniref:hypothetical protein n=1 Tax=Paenibacillus tarimensis TaxID=416012 RepID=UPI001F29F0FE|nr:hypothetical protein [Paenibacillus tarimensis]MCF2945552.1 hypothetical protein [Paenibacillus tarimensis]